jgi:tellurite resistance protein
MTQTPPPRVRPKAYPAPEFPPRKAALFARTPPAAFPVVMGLLGLGLALRRGAEALQLPSVVSEMPLGAISVLWLFCVLAYGAKLARRPGVLLEDLRVLPGRAGVAALILSGLLVAAVLVPYAPGLAQALLIGGLMVHGAFALLMARVLVTSPPEGRVVTPVWHLIFVGFILGGIAAAELGMAGLAHGILIATMPVAAVIWAISLYQLATRIPPAPLRPLLAIHLAPASLFATVAALTGQSTIAAVALLLGGVILSMLVAGGKWLTEAGFSALWGAFTFPLAAYVSALYALGMDVTGTVLLIPALGFIPFVALRVMKAWAKGDLAAKTNAAEA